MQTVTRFRATENPLGDTHADVKSQAATAQERRRTKRTQGRRTSRNFRSDPIHPPVRAAPLPSAERLPCEKRASITRQNQALYDLTPTYREEDSANRHRSGSKDRNLVPSSPNAPRPSQDRVKRIRLDRALSRRGGILRIHSWKTCGTGRPASSRYTSLRSHAKQSRMSSCGV